MDRIEAQITFRTGQKILDTSAAIDEMKRRSRVDIEAKSNIPNVVQELVDSMHRLETISNRAARKGGTTASDRDEATRLIEKSRQDAAAYDRVLGNIGRELDLLYEKKHRLEYIPWTSPQ